MSGDEGGTVTRLKQPSKRLQRAIDEAKVAFSGLSPGEAMIVFEGVLTEQFGLAFRDAMKESENTIIKQAEEDYPELRRRARAVVDARFAAGGSWDDLKEAIGNLADLVGGGEIHG